jgi:hypothetical protein
MATYVNDLRLKEIATGDESGTWGTSTNTNLELIAEAFSYGTEVITTNADTHTTTIADGASDPGRALYLKYTGTLDSACTITIGPNTVSKVWIIENGTSGSQNIIISQGSGANITIPAGDTKVVYSDGAGAGAAFFDAFASLSVVDLKVQDDLTVTGDIDVDGTTNLDVVDIDGAVDMASTALVTGVLTANGGAVFNEAGADVDFRVESDTVDHALFVQGSDGFVGIGTASPAYKLEVESSSDADLIQIQSTASANNTILRLGISGDIATLNASGDSTGALAFKTYGTERMRINSTGVVSIGNTENTGYSDDYLVQVGTDGAGSNSFGMLIRANESGTSKLGFADGNDADGTGKVWYDHSSNYMRFDTAATERMRIDSSGNVGIGVTPSAWGANYAALQSVLGLGLWSTRNTSATILGSNAYNANEVDDRYVVSYWASKYTQVAGEHNWYTAPSGTAGDAITYTNSMTIDASGNLLVGRTSVGATGNGHSIRGGDSAIFSRDAVGESMIVGRNASAGDLVRFYCNNADKGSIDFDGSNTISYTSSSDYRLKEDDVPMTGATERVKALRPINFAWKSDGSRVDGFLAHEVQEIVPEAISGTKDAMRDEEYEVTPAVLDDDGNVVTKAVMGTRSVPDYQGIDQSKLVPLLVKTIQELEARITTLENA